MMSVPLSKQERHNLAMNIVGKDLEELGYEFMGVNSDLKKNPQFVALKNKTLHFVIVRAVLYPSEPEHYDIDFMTSITAHAQKFDAKVFYAGVGLGHGTDYALPPVKEEPYTQLYRGLQELL